MGDYLATILLAIAAAFVVLWVGTLILQAVT
jgi:hypothetical protein